MAVSIKINGTTYRATNKYSIKQQGAAVSNTTLMVLLGANPVPLIFQQAQIYLGASLFFTGLSQKVGTPEYSSEYETNVFTIEVSSLECLFNHRLVTKNFYYYTYNSWPDVVQYLFTNYIAQENITLGEISTTASTFDSKYSVKDKKLFDVLNDIADAIGNASWWISPDRKFYFRIKTDFDSVTAPTHLKKLKLIEEPGDIRTIQKVVGASAGINATATNASLITTIAARTGGSGKIEMVDSDSDIHSDTKALAAAGVKLNTFGESTKTINCICHDLAASALFNSWPLSLTINGVSISGNFVVVERTITDRGPSAFQIAVTLKNNNYFARYGYALKHISEITNTNSNALSDIASDEKLTASEKINELPRWQEALALKTSLDADADTYGVSRVTFDDAFIALSTYLNAGVAWTSGTPAWFAGEVYTETTDIVGADYDANWKAFSDARNALEIAIRAAIQGNADDAIAAAHEASIRMTVSANNILRSRAGVLSPASLSVSAKYGDTNAAYAGRFEIAHSIDGSTYDIDKGLPSDARDNAYTATWTSGVDGWIAGTGNVVSVDTGRLKMVYTAGSNNGCSAYKTLSFASKKVALRITSANIIQNVRVRHYASGSATDILFTAPLVKISDYIWIIETTSITNISSLAININNNIGVDASNTGYINWLYVGTAAYYLQGAWLTVDGWNANVAGPLTVSGGRLIATAGQGGGYKTGFGDLQGRTVLARVISSTGGIHYISYRVGTVWTTYSSLSLAAGVEAVHSVVLPRGNVIDALVIGGVAGVAYSWDLISIGPGTAYSQDGWLTQDGWASSVHTTLSLPSGLGVLRSTHNGAGNDPTVYRNNLFFEGGAFRKILLRVMRRSGNDPVNWQVYYETAAHGFSASYYKNVTITLPLNEWVNVSIDMSVLNAGGSDWISNIITGVRLDEGSTTDTVLDYDYIYMGNEAADWYRSAVDESSKTHTLAVTSFGSYVTRVRARLYKAGGFVTIFEEEVAAINADPSAASIYWGSLTNAPTSGIQTNDYYFDSNSVAGGGGKIRYYTGSTWAEATSAWSGFFTAQAAAMNDMVAWTNIYGADLIAAVTAMITDLTAQTAFIGQLTSSSAFIESLTAASAFLTELFSQSITLLEGGIIESDNFVAGTSGFRLTGETGLVEAVAAQLINCSISGTLTSAGVYAYDGRVFIGDGVVSVATFNQKNAPASGNSRLQIRANALYVESYNGSAWVSYATLGTGGLSTTGLSGSSISSSGESSADYFRMGMHGSAIGVYAGRLCGAAASDDGPRYSDNSSWKHFQMIAGW